MPTAADNRVLDLSYLFSAPLVSTIEADVLAARKFAQFIEEFGFEKPDDGSDPAAGHLGKLRTFTFDYQRKDASGELRPSTLTVPALSIVPLPTLQVAEAEFSYRVRVVGALATEKPKRFLALDAAGSQPAPGAEEVSPRLPQADQFRFRAMLAPDRPDGGGDGTGGGASSSSPAVDANLKVKVRMKQADLPAGISALLNVMSESIHSRRNPTPEEKTTP